MNAYIRHPLAGFTVSAILLTAILGYMVVDRVLLLRNGREIVLPIRPVDPRDLFKGDYVRLGYEISRPSVVTYDEQLFPQRGRPQKVYVTLEQMADGAWKPIAMNATLPANLPGNRIAIRGQTTVGDNFVRYGLERYYVPEGKGMTIEGMARTGQLSAVIAVDRKGNAAIKGLMIDGRRVYDEPLL